MKLNDGFRVGDVFVQGTVVWLILAVDSSQTSLYENIVHMRIPIFFGTLIHSSDRASFSAWCRATSLLRKGVVP